MMDDILPQKKGAARQGRPKRAHGEARVGPANVDGYFSADKVVEDYAQAALWVGLWKSERMVFERIFEPSMRLLDMGCGAGRVGVGLWKLGYRRITGIDLSHAMAGRAQALADSLQIPRGELSFAQGDATDLTGVGDAGFGGAIFAFNGLMQIPGRQRRRRALRELARVVVKGGPFFFTTHDRGNPFYAAFWKEERRLWDVGAQDAALTEFGDRYYDSPLGKVFMHVPSRAEILEDLAACGWLYEEDCARCEWADESAQVREFSDECRLWVARRA